jgi:uncharacterized membrane protein YqiK
MNTSQFGFFLLGLISLAIVVAILLWIVRRLYVRSSKDRAFVRTGLGGQKVVLDAGAFVLPMVHEVIPVNMNTLRLEVRRGQEQALITRDRMRVDVTAEFLVRVQATAAAVAAAAQTLGYRTLEAEKLRELIEGKFVDALRTIAADTTLEDLHEKRGAYTRQVRESVAQDLISNGLELQSISLTQLEQADITYFNPSNAFDAEGLTRLTEQIEQRKKERNDVEQNTLIAIRNKNLESEKLVLEIDREGEYARLTQQREVEVARARQRSEVSRERAEHEREAEQVQITAKQAIEAARIRAELTLDQDRIRKAQALQAAEIERRMAMDLAEQKRTIAVAEQSRAQSEAHALADEARALAVAAEERVSTARQIEAAERAKAIELIAAAQAGEQEALRLKLAVDAEKDAAEGRGTVVRMQAEADAQAERIRIEAARVRAEMEADAQRQMNEAHNVLSPEARVSGLRHKLLDKVEGIVRESVRPLEHIESIKILSVDGLGGPAAAAGGTESGGALSDQVVNSALRYRAQAPLIDKLLGEIGVDVSSADRLANSLTQPAGTRDSGTQG